MPASPLPTRVFVVTPFMLLHGGLVKLVQAGVPDIEFSGGTATLAEAEAALETADVDVLVVDVDELRPESLAEFRPRRRPKVLALSTLQPHKLQWVVQAGARGLVNKSDTPAAFLKAVRKVHQGELWFSRSVMSDLLDKAFSKEPAAPTDVDQRLASLTQRERQTIVAMASDAAAPGKVIASRLSMSEHTLRNHLTSIYDKLKLRNRLDLYAFATRCDFRNYCRDGELPDQAAGVAGAAAQDQRALPPS